MQRFARNWKFSDARCFPRTGAYKHAAEKFLLRKTKHALRQSTFRTHCKSTNNFLTSHQNLVARNIDRRRPSCIEQTWNWSQVPQKNSHMYIESRELTQQTAKPAFVKSSSSTSFYVARNTITLATNTRSKNLWTKISAIKMKYQAFPQHRKTSRYLGKSK